MNPTPKTRRRGRQPKFVPDPITGDPVIGLRYWETRNKYFVYALDEEGNNTTTRIILGDDFTVAKYRLEQIMAERAGETFTTAHKPEYAESFAGKAEITFTDEVAAALEAGKINPADIIEGIKIIHTDIPDSFCIDRVRQLILDDLKNVSKRMNLPLKFDGDIHPEHSIRLEKLLSLFIDRDDPLGKQQRLDATNYWNQFCKTIKVKTVREITKEHIKKFNKYVRSSKYAPRTKKNILDMVVGVFDHALKEIDNSSDINEINTVLGYCKSKFKRPTKGIKRKPQKFSRDDFDKVYKIDDSETKAMLMLALNTGMKQTAITEVKVADIDFNANTLSNERPKTGVIRSAILMEETVEAIKEWLKIRSFDSDYLFLNDDNEKCNLNYFSRIWNKIRKETGIKAEFRHIRDSVQNIPVEAGVEFNLVKILLGQEIPGISNSYTERNPQKTKTAVRAIYKYYFAKK